MLDPRITAIQLAEGLIGVFGLTDAKSYAENLRLSAARHDRAVWTEVLSLLFSPVPGIETEGGDSNATN